MAVPLQQSETQLEVMTSNNKKGVSLLNRVKRRLPVGGSVTLKRQAVRVVQVYNGNKEEQ